MPISLRFRELQSVNNVLPKFGMNTYLKSEGLGTVFLEKAEEVLLSDNKNIIVRDNINKKVNLSGIHSLWAEGDFCFFRKGSSIYRLLGLMTAW